MMIHCRYCDQDTDNVAPHAIGLRTCRICSSKQLAIRRGKEDIVKRILINLKRTLRSKKMIEATLWERRHVQALYDAFTLPPVIKLGMEEYGMQPKFQIVRVNDQKPYLPGNVQLVLRGT